MVFDDDVNLGECLASVRRGLTDPERYPILVVEGRYSKFPGGDGCSEFDYRPWAGVYQAGPWPGGYPTEFIKRTFQFVMASVGDWVMVIDADERLHLQSPSALEAALGDEPDGSRQLMIANHGKDPKTGDPFQRIFRINSGFHVFGAHWYHWRSGRSAIVRGESKKIPYEVAWLEHMRDPGRAIQFNRAPERAQRKSVYHSEGLGVDEHRQRTLQKWFL